MPGKIYLSAFVAFYAACLPMIARGDSSSVGQFRKLAHPRGEFQISGYVVKQYSCPPCPAGALCKPCMRNNVLISDAKELSAGFPEQGNYLVVFTEEPENLVLGKFYKMTVEVVEGKTSRHGEHDLILKNAVEQTKPQIR